MFPPVPFCSSQVHHPTALDTASNEEGSYGGSDPSPSSAGTVVPSYTSAFNATTGGEALPSNAASNLISEAVQAVRAQEVALPAGAIPRDTQPRSQSLQSTTTSISDRPSSYDDYHEFWTSASNSQSQSDSLTSMSSYRSSAVGGHRYSSSHLSGAALPGAIQGGGLTTAGADGMILSMSRSSLCASPLSIAEEREEAAYQGTSRGRTAPKDEDIAQSTDSSRQGQHKHLKPSLPSLSSSLKEDRYNPASLIQLSPDRTASLPLPTPHMSASPPQPPYLPSSWRQYPHRQIHRSEQLGPQASQGHTHSRSPDSHPHTLPPIASVLQSHEATLPAPSHPDLFPPAKKQFLTRNGRGKTTSYPIFEVPREVNNDRSSADSGASFQWPSSAPTAPRTSIADTSSYDGSSVLPLPLPRRAATRAPLSSTRDDSDDTAMSTSATEEKDQAEHLHQQAEEKTSQLGKEIVMSPSDYNDEGDGLTESAISREGAPQAGGDKKLPPRRKSTYEDFVELFGSHGTV